jgi:hypothetical protein
MKRVRSSRGSRSPKKKQQSIKKQRIQKTPGPAFRKLSFSEKTLRTIMDHILSNNREICGNLTFNQKKRQYEIQNDITEGTMVTDPSKLKETGGIPKAYCKLKKYGYISFHTHPKGFSMYPSADDIVFTFLFKHKIEIIFTMHGFWILKNNGIQLSQKILQDIFNELVKIYFKNDFHSYCEKLDPKRIQKFTEIVSKYLPGYLIFFVPWSDYYLSLRERSPISIGSLLTK